MKIFVALFLVMVSADSNLESQIFKGKEANDGDFPYDVSLYNSKPSRNYLCGGSLISKTFIVTAAHCVLNLRPEVISVFLGSRHLLQGSERVVRNKIIHPGYSVQNYDIALLEIDPITYSDTIKAINLPPLSDLNLSYEAHIAVASGWGYTNRTHIVPRTLQYTHLLVISNTACKEAYPVSHKVHITEDVICAADPDESLSCLGDSGGPLVDIKSKNLIGITAFVPTSSCGEVHFGTVFTRVTSSRQWIYNTTGI